MAKKINFNIIYSELALLTTLAMTVPPSNSRPTCEIMAIVDDDPGLSLALGAWLEFNGWRATHHISGESLMQIVKLQDSTVQVEVGITDPIRFRLMGAVIDLNLPGISGVETARLLRQLDPDLPIVIVTAIAQHEWQHYDPLPEGVQFVQKPFTLDALESALHPLTSKLKNASASVF